MEEVGAHEAFERGTFCGFGWGRAADFSKNGIKVSHRLVSYLSLQALWRILYHILGENAMGKGGVGDVGEEGRESFFTFFDATRFCVVYI